MSINKYSIIAYFQIDIEFRIWLEFYIVGGNLVTGLYLEIFQ